MCDREYVAIELDFTPDTIELLEALVEKTDFSMSQVIEYILGDMILREAIQDIKAERFNI